MPSNISRSRLTKAFNEGRRAAKDTKGENPYDNAKLRALWEEGREQQVSGKITSPIPPLERGETRAQRAVQNPPKPKRPAPPPRGAGGFRDRDRGQRGRNRF